MTYEYGGKDTKTFVKLYGYKNLVVWQKASDLSVLVNHACGNFGHGYYKLTDQMRGAATSVKANIAEGYCNASLANYIRFCLIARGSLGELGSYLQDCERWGLLGGDSLAKMISLYGDTTFLLDRLIHSLREKEKDGSWDKQFWAKEQGEFYDTGGANQG